jgi:hypothetical protein
MRPFPLKTINFIKLAVEAENSQEFSQAPAEIVLPLQRGVSMIKKKRR